MATRDVAGARIELVHGNITHEKTDAIVNRYYGCTSIWNWYPDTRYRNEDHPDRHHNSGDEDRPF